MSKAMALSLKQPWAALLAHGRKTIEVRKWPTRRRGRVLIHASRLPDERLAAWERLPADLVATAQLLGGIIGAGEITSCVRYGSKATFEADVARHLNDPDWFQPPALYGFTFVNLTVLPFRSYSGWMKFFEVEEGERGA